MANPLNIPQEIIKKICEIFPYYYKDLKEDSYLNDLWDTLFSDFKKFFQEKKELIYFIEKNGFSYQGETFIPPPSGINFHQNLFNERCLAILFKDGIDKGEIISFFNLFKIPFSKMSYKDQSLKIFLLRENFKNISFFFLDDEEISREGLEKYKNLLEKAKNLQNESFKLSKEKGEIKFDFEEKKFETNLISEPIKRFLKFLFEETTIAILSQYEKETNLDYKVLLMQSLRYLYQEVISSADFKKINFILRNLKLKDDKNLKELFIEFQSEEVFKNLIKAISKIDFLKLEDFISFYENLDKGFQKVFVMKILEENITKNREEIYEILSQKVEKDKEFLIEIYNEIDKNKVQNFLYLFQKLPEDFLTEEELLSHKNLSVKASVLKVCKKLSDKKILEFLDSESPDLRIEALNYIERFRKDAFVPIIISRIKRENFYEKTKEEKEKHFEVLGKIKNSEAISFLKELLTEHKLFSSQKKEEIRAMAAIALALTGDVRFKEILQRESKSIANSNLVKEACKRASEIIERKK